MSASLSCSDKTYNGENQVACSCSGGTVGGAYQATNAGTYTASCSGDSNHTNPSNKSWTMNGASAWIECVSSDVAYLPGTTGRAVCVCHGCRITRTIYHNGGWKNYPWNPQADGTIQTCGQQADYICYSTEALPNYTISGEISSGVCSIR